MSDKRRSTWKTGISLLCVIAAGILLNILGTKVNAALGLPLFIDDIGTVLVAVAGGYIPCITVGFLTNIIIGFTDYYTTYYCIISVLIAVAAVSFAKQLRKFKIPYMLLAVVTFAFFGGVVGGFLTWLINGFSFGEGFSVDMAALINRAVPIGYVPSNILSCFAIDFVDKALVTIVAMAIYQLLPRRLLKNLKNTTAAFCRCASNQRS